MTPIVCAALLVGCTTGKRPRLVTDDTLPTIDDVAIASVAEILNEPPSTATFRVTYTITTKFGGEQTKGSISVDPDLGTSIHIGGSRFLTSPNGSITTCSWLTERCTPGLDETSVAGWLVTSRIFKGAIVDRLRQDATVAVGESVASTTTVEGHPIRCVDVPVIDDTGLTRNKSYCAFEDLGVLASLDTGDLSIEVTTTSTTVDPADYEEKSD